MKGIHYSVTRWDHPLAEFAEEADALDFASRKAREYRGSFTVYVSRVDPCPDAKNLASWRSDRRGHISGTGPEGFDPNVRRRKARIRSSKK